GYLTHAGIHAISISLDRDNQFVGIKHYQASVGNLLTDSILGQTQSWLTSFRWENGNGMLTQLNREFPTVSLLDIGAILKQVGQVL
ncbi:hypothetical protein MJI47_27520, partial [Salmonella enterica subsp. enterica serovar Kentucky]|nr:hypothetical protein [Salmonella enterica subsp. enterica serovar Kentucky]